MQMEGHVAGCHPSMHGGGHGHLQHYPAALAYGAWAQPPLAALDGGGEQLDCSSELRLALLRALSELDAARAELRRVESEAARLVASAAAERDELRRHCHSLLLLLHSHTQTPPPPPPPPSQSLIPEPLHAGVLLRGGGGARAMDEQAPDAEAELEMALTRRLPEKGRLVDSVVAAGPLLQTLLLAGPLPRWRRPPPPAPADIPPFNPGNHSYSSSPESNYGGVPTPVAALPCFHHTSSLCM